MKLSLLIGLIFTSCAETSDKCNSVAICQMEINDSANCVMQKGKPIFTWEFDKSIHTAIYVGCEI